MGNAHKTYRKRARRLYRILIVISVMALITAIAAFYLYEDENASKDNPEYSDPTEAREVDQLEKSIDSVSGFIQAPGLRETIINCTPCHSAQLVTQNRMTKEGWLSTIRWMQKTQNLWDLGENEPIILEYLATNYAPVEKGRRENLEVTEWYVLEE
ncbi:monoheme cytochrome C [Ulvibacterium marinum]|uniref:monoheme cytochrome C n=1 Tax=Ulvibacterium marinum TaxID=2419782 RepID=UPI001B86D672|nr:monoheme cytochrome C [Ulvibacterium marinum]